MADAEGAAVNPAAASPAPINPAPVNPECLEGCYVVNSCTNIDVPNEPYFPKAANVQIILAEPTIEVCVQSTIMLECPAIEIKRIRKDAFIFETQCKLVPTCNRLLYKLFVNGYIRANIEYAGVDQCNPTAMCGDIRHTTVQIPYSACTEIKFPPEGPLPIFTRVVGNMAEFTNLGQGPRLDKNLFQSSACYINQPIVTLVCVNFQEYAIGDNVCSTECPDRTFNKLNDFTAMNLRLRVLQFQPMPLPAYAWSVYPLEEEGLES